MTHPVDKNVLKKYRKYESTALKMMDRQDTGNVTGDKFGYNERKRLYIQLLEYWESVVEVFDIDAVMFHFAPHMVYDYVLYAVCVENDIKTAIFTITSLPNTYYVRNRINETPNELHNIDEDEDISPDIQAYLQQLRADYDTGKPEYMQKYSLQEYLSKLSTFSEYPDYVDYVFNRIAPGGASIKHYKEKGELIEDSSVGRFQSMLYNLGAERYKSELSKYYEKLTEPADTDTDYIFYSLHYQPERTTCPEGGVFVNQYLAVNLLAECIPDNWKLYVKEHPHQVVGKKKGEMGRQKFMYDDLSEINGVTLVDMDIDSFELIDDAQATATITGTSGWESINRGIPAIVFGAAWYRDCPGCIQVETKQEVQKAINKIQKKDIVDDKRTLQFVNEIEKVSYSVYVSSGTKSKSISKQENVRGLSAALIEWWEREANDESSSQPTVLSE